LAAGGIIERRREAMNRRYQKRVIERVGRDVQAPDSKVLIIE